MTHWNRILAPFRRLHRTLRNPTVDHPNPNPNPNHDEGHTP